MKSSTLLIVLLVIYLIGLVVIGFMDIRRSKSFSDFAVAGKKQASFVVIMSLLATVIGASTTMGLTDTVFNIGFPGIWWLAFGAIGLILQSLFISKKVREMNSDTLPHAAGMMLGRPAELIISLIIVVSWVGVIAGQFVAMNGLITFITGKNSKTVFVIVIAAVILYITIGGQLSVVKTDVIQFLIIIFGILTCFVYLYFFKEGETGVSSRDFELINDNYRPINLVTQFFIIGGVYFLGPDIMSRNLISKNSKTARRSAMLSGVFLLAYSVILVLIGVWARRNISAEELNGMNTLLYVISEKIPSWVGAVMSLGLVSAMISTIDTCIINSSTIFVKDILKKDSVGLVRIAVVVNGALALIFALSDSGDIIKMLSNAYSVYTPGVIFPLLVAILAYKKKSINVVIWVASVLAGGVFGFTGAYFSEFIKDLHLPEFISNNLSLVGMGISLIGAVISVLAGGKSKFEEKE